MKSLKRIMVGLDLTAMDDIIIDYVSYLSDILGFEKIYFVHVESKLDIPDELASAFPEMAAPLDEQIREKIEEKVSQHFNNWREIGVEIDVKEGDPLKELMHWTHVKKIDLLVAGRKKAHPGEGILPNNVLRKSTTSVLFVTENAKRRINKISVPVDFSEHSKLAMEEAVYVAQKAQSEQIICHNVYKIPTGYYKTGKSYEEFSEIMRGHAEEKSKEFLAKLDNGGIDIKAVFTRDDDTDTMSDIVDVAMNEDADMIILGSKGQSDTAVMLLGSMAEKVINKEYTIPMLVLKKKNENLGFFEALLRL